MKKINLTEIMTIKKNIKLEDEDLYRIVGGSVGTFMVAMTDLDEL